MLKVYNTLKREKVEFKPLVEGKVGMYVCGVTPYLNDSRKIHKIGVNISSETRTVAEWKVK